MIVHYENAKSHVKEICRSEQCLCLDLRALGAVGYICFTAAESQNSLQERTRLFIGQSPTALDYTALALGLAARGEHGFKPGCICCASYPGTYSKQGQARSSYCMKLNFIEIKDSERQTCIIYGGNSICQGIIGSNGSQKWKSNSLSQSSQRNTYTVTVRSPVSTGFYCNCVVTGL